MPLATADQPLNGPVCLSCQPPRRPAQQSPLFGCSTVDRGTYCGSHVHEDAKRLQFQHSSRTTSSRTQAVRAARTDAIALRTNTGFTKSTTVLASSRDSSSNEALPKLRSARNSGARDLGFIGANARKTYPLLLPHIQLRVSFRPAH